MMPVAVCSVGLIAASCSTDDNVTLGEPLPEGMYPIEFTATGLQATPQTRATADDTWNGGDNVAIQIGEDVKQYKATRSQVSTTELTPTYNRFYWQNTNDVTVQAWYCGTAYNATLPTSWKVQSDQSGTDGYQNSDFLYAQDNFKFGNTNALNFYHQTAQVWVYIFNGDNTPADINITTYKKIKSLTIGDNGNIYLEGRWKAPTNTQAQETNGYDVFESASSDTKGTITPKPFFSGQITVDGIRRIALANYKALVIPQTIKAGEKLFVIHIDGYSPFYYKVPDGGIEWKAGIRHVYYIFIKGSKLSVTASSSIGWDADGASGSGSVTID